MRMRKAILSLIMFALVFTTACSGEKNETGTTEQEQGVNSELTKDDLKNPDDTVPTGEKDLGSGGGETIGKGDSVVEKEGNEDVDSKASYGKKNNITRTIMIYVVGSDLESQGGAASYDIIEMMDSGVDLSVNNVLLYTGGTNEWWLTAIPSNRNMIYELQEDGFAPVSEQMTHNMGESYTLAGFLAYCKENYPAEQFGLILWDHGGGPMLGYGLDEQTGDLLEMSEIVDALEEAGFTGRDKLEFLGFDACLMGAVETGWCLKDSAKYLIASQETEPGWGWNYAFLRELRYCEDGADIGKEIIDYYMATGEAIFDEEPYAWSDLTLSCLDLTKIDELEEALDELYGEVVPDLYAGYFTQASRSRTRTKTFGQFTSNTSFDLVDLGDMITFLEDDYEEEAEALQQALDDFVCYSQANVADATGVSIFYPYENREYMAYWMDMYDDFGFAPSYTEYLWTFSQMLGTQRSDAWSTMRSIQGSAVELEDSCMLTFQLTPEQMENYAYSQYIILRKIGEDKYIFVVNSDDTKIDDTGLVSAGYNNRMVFAVNARTGERSEYPIPMMQVRDGISKDRYTTSAIMFALPNADTLLTDTTVGEIQFVLGETPEMYSIYPDSNGDNLLPAKQLLDYREFDVIDVGVGVNKPTRYEDGEMKPFSEWDDTSMFLGTSLPVSDGIHFEYQNVSSDGEYYYMFQMYDLQGNCTASELFPLPTGDDSDRNSVTGEKTVMETERADYANLIQGVTVKSAEAFNAETQIELSDELDDFTFGLDGYTYQLPMPLSYLKETGWIYYSWCDFDDINLTPGDYQKAYMHKNGKTIQIEVFNTSAQNKKFKDCVVGRVSFEFPTEADPVIAKNTLASTVNLDDVITIFGNPDFVTMAADEKSVTLEYYFGYSDLILQNYCCYEMCFSVETKQLESLEITNYDETEEASDREDIQYLKAYEAPEELGEDLLSWNVQLLGDVYTLPAPVSAFTENGWEIILAQNVKAGKDLDKGIIMQKDGVVVEFSVFNFSEHQTSAADATVYKLAQSETGISPMADLQLVLPGNICIGMTEADFLKLLEKDATVKEVFSVYEYENYDGTKSVRYTYADSMTAAREFNFVDGKLKGISIYNKRCGYRSNTGETLTKSR